MATARVPEGPFTDSGYRLTPEPFAIDAHVATDAQGNRYLFYATDFLDHSHIGTGTVRARMRDPFTLAEAAVPVTRAKYDWQVYDPNRAEKGGVRWHTVEGPFVLRHKGLYYQMFSGGNWQNPSYGVSYALSPTLDNPQEWEQHADGEITLPILRTDREQGIIGPGHNSVVRGPDNRQWYCIYHRWAADGSGRQMAIDPLDWAGERMVLTGPSASAQPAPIMAGARDFAAAGWHFEGEGWTVAGEKATVRSGDGEATAVYDVASPYFLLELWLRFEETQQGIAGVELAGEGTPAMRFEIESVTRSYNVRFARAIEAQGWSLPEGFDCNVAHRIRIVVNGRQVTLAVDDNAIRWAGPMRTSAHRFRLLARGGAAHFESVAITRGWEESWQGGESLEALGWEADPAAAFTLDDGRLHLRASESEATLAKGSYLRAYEWVLAFKATDAREGAVIRLLPAQQEDGSGVAFVLTRTGAGWAAAWDRAEGQSQVTLPQGFTLEQAQLLRFRKEAGRLTVRREAQILGGIEVEDTLSRVGLAASGVGLEIETARVTEIPDGAYNGS